MKSMLDEKITSPAQFVDQYEQMEEKFIRGKYGCVFMYTGLWVHFLMLMYMGKIKYIWHRFPCFMRKIH